MAGYMPKSVHPVNQDERCPYIMIEEEIVAIGGMTVDKLQHKEEHKKNSDKYLYCFGLPDGKGGHYYEVKGQRHFELYAQNASNLINCVKALKAKAGAISEERETAVRETVKGLANSGLATIAIQAAVCAQYNIKVEEFNRVMAANQETAKATIA